MPFDYLLPSSVTAMITLAATVGLLLMYRLRHNKAIIGLIIANVWMFVTYALDALGLLDSSLRIVMARSGFSLLEFAIMVGSAVFIAKRRTHV